MNNFSFLNICTELWLSSKIWDDFARLTPAGNATDVTIDDLLPSVSKVPMTLAADCQIPSRDSATNAQ